MTAYWGGCFPLALARNDARNTLGSNRPADCAIDGVIAVGPDVVLG